MRLSEKLEELSNKKSFTKEEVILYDFLIKLSRLDSLLVDRKDSTYLIVGAVEEEGRIEDGLYWVSPDYSPLKYKKIDDINHMVYFEEVETSLSWSKDSDGLVPFSYEETQQNLFPYRVVKLEF